MPETVTKPRTKVKAKTERPRLHKVILVNDDFTPREFVVTVLKAEFRMTEDQAHKVMITAHRAAASAWSPSSPGTSPDQGDPRHRRRPRQGLSAAVHHRAGRIIPDASWTRQSAPSALLRGAGPMSAPHFPMDSGSATHHARERGTLRGIRGTRSASRRFIRQSVDALGLGKSRDRKFAEIGPAAAGADFRKTPPRPRRCA